MGEIRQASGRNWSLCKRGFFKSAGSSDQVHADAWWMQTYAQAEHIVVQAEQQQQPFIYYYLFAVVEQAVNLEVDPKFAVPSNYASPDPKGDSSCHEVHGVPYHKYCGQQGHCFPNHIEIWPANTLPDHATHRLLLVGAALTAGERWPGDSGGLSHRAAQRCQQTCRCFRLPTEILPSRCAAHWGTSYLQGLQPAAELGPGLHSVPAAVPRQYVLERRRSNNCKMRATEPTQSPGSKPTGVLFVCLGEQRCTVFL